MTRRRSTPWIHKWSRFIIAGIATCGALTTAYLTFEKLTGGQAACVVDAGGKGCNDVLSSPWATVFGQPLALFGLLAYVGMATLALAPLAFKPEKNKQQYQKIQDSTWLLLLSGAIAMTVFSGYLMYLLAFKIQALCPYCLASATFSLSMLVLTIIGRTWEDIGQIFFTAIVVGMITLIGTLGVYNNVNNPNAGQPSTPVPTGQPTQGIGWKIATTSGESEIELARHLKKIGAKKYAAWTCPHCHEQKQLFGKEAVEELDIIECHPEGKNARVDLCQAAGIRAFPTWKINGQELQGVQPLKKLAEVSGYKGPTNFKNFPDYFK
ncbi:MAG: vitamin K epoxide reductase family protein [Calothrix sp. MO_167.B42]|nr:vitamin K epoxide reductase family protein [Calothrix sp. MO_167.B42]